MDDHETTSSFYFLFFLKNMILIAHVVHTKFDILYESQEDNY